MMSTVMYLSNNYLRCLSVSGVMEMASKKDLCE